MPQGIAHIQRHMPQTAAAYKANVQPRPQPKPALTDFACSHVRSYLDQSADCRNCLTVSTSEIHAVIWITTHLPTPGYDRRVDLIG